VHIQGQLVAWLAYMEENDLGAKLLGQFLRVGINNFGKIGAV
jgi:hypothetical protein